MRPPGVSAVRVGKSSITASESLCPASSCGTEVIITAQLERRSRVAHKDDSFELVWPNDPVLVFIEVTERLTQPLALQALHKLCKFIVCETHQRRLQ